MRDSLYDSVAVRPALAIATRTANQAYNGISVDKSYQSNFFKTVMFVIHTGTLTDGTMTFTMEDSDDNSAWAAVATTYIQGTLPAIAATSDDTVFQIAYLGPKRYVRVVGTLASATSGGAIGVTALLSDARRKPVIL